MICKRLMTKKLLAGVVLGDYTMRRDNHRLYGRHRKSGHLRARRWRLWS